MSENRTILGLAVGLAFTTGVLVTLLSTGSIRTHSQDASGEKILNEPLHTLESAAEATVREQSQDIARATTESSHASALPSGDDMALFLQENMDLLQIVPDDASNEEATNILYEEFSSAPSIKQGEGDGQIFILFDPLCRHCHELFKNFSRGLLEQHNLSAYWIPAVAFLDNPKSMEYSQKLTSAILSGRHDLAFKAMEQLMHSESFSALESPGWDVTTDSILRVARNTVGLLQSSTGTPTLIYKNNKNTVEIVEGIPTSEDLAEVWMEEH